MWVHEKMRVRRKNILFLSLLSLLLAATSARADFAAGIAAYKQKDFKAALKEFKNLAQENPTAKAQFYLGIMYAKGQGVVRDLSQSRRWFHKAALQGHVAAQYYLGLLYAKGLGVARDIDQAVNWYRKAALQGHVSAQFSLGLMYANGQGVARNHTQAAKWFGKAALKGHASAQHNLGVMYDKGMGVAKSHTQAAKWFGNGAGVGGRTIQSRCYVRQGPRRGQGPLTSAEVVSKGGDKGLRRCPI